MQITTIGLDIAKNVLQVHGIDAAEKVVVRKQLRRGQTERRVAAFGSAAARLMRAYAMQVEVLRRLRNGGQQFVRVEHVHINDGGNAIIGNVKSPDSLSEPRG
jgi:hypothetical protein